MSEKRVLEDFLNRKGLRFTKEREAILEGVASLSGHFDLEELLLSLRGKGLKVSRASVYRTLPLLVESGLVEEVERVDKHAHYEATFGVRHHDHMLCMNCGRVIEFYSPDLERLQERLCRSRGFRGETHTLEIRGQCRDCVRKSRGKHK